MELIPTKEFLIAQPGYPEPSPSDIFYHATSIKLLKLWNNAGVLSTLTNRQRHKIVLALTGYYQDIVSDGGLWRTFINEYRHLYGSNVPFYKDKGEYIEYELNRIDVRFMTWYAVAMYCPQKRFVYPYNSELLELADIFYEEMEKEYDEAPVAETFRMSHELEFNSEEDREMILKIGSWVYKESWLMTPAFEMTRHLIAEKASEENISEVDLIEEAMASEPIGPLAMYLNEWMWMLIENKTISPVADEKDNEEHKYYSPFLEATNGSEIAYFDSYEKMNRFFIDVLGWDAKTEHLSHLKKAHDFTLLINRTKGLLIACNVARCIADPANSLYDMSYACQNAFDLLTVRGLCPPDLRKRILNEGWLPDAVFPGTDDRQLVADNADFIARCFLQLYYRGD